MLSRENSKPAIEVVLYDGKLDTNVVLDWISDMENFFDFEGALLIIGRQKLQSLG